MSSFICAVPQPQVVDSCASHGGHGVLCRALAGQNGYLRVAGAESQGQAIVNPSNQGRTCGVLELEGGEGLRVKESAQYLRGETAPDQCQIKDLQVEGSIRQMLRLFPRFAQEVSPPSTPRTSSFRRLSGR